MVVMYTFRYNPSVGRWVLLGGAVTQSLHLTSAHLIHDERDAEFVAATYPRQPFIVEPPERFGHPDDLLYAEQPPVGEYELLLYRGPEPMAAWDAKLWERWIMLVQRRLIQLLHNPYLHHVRLTYRTAAEQGIDGFHRVGDLMATSHPIAGEPAELTAEMAAKIREREPLFTVHADQFGSLQVPSAPLYYDEVWYLPHHARSSLEMVHGEEREGLARTLAMLMRKLRSVHRDRQYILELHTSLAPENEEITWWIQVYREMHHDSLLPVQPLPETVVQQLRYTLS